MVQYFKTIWSGIATTFTGMKITLKHLFTKKVTIQYPDENFPLPETARNRLFMEMTKCIGCKNCAKICPVNCIDIETIKVSPEDPHKELHRNGKERKLWVPTFEIDFAKCCYCGLCTEVCPTDAIIHTKEFEYSEYNRENLVYKFHTLTPEQTEEKRRLLEELDAKKEKEKKQDENKPGNKETPGEKRE
ncbi:NuoI/complex I 23 kDa subunit family protein [Sunxiuqinia dokdonensis]|nr:NADH-quinone oxidoreductase subunit I [Sunxiuqinia dokdonensis]